MSSQNEIGKYETLPALADKFREDLKSKDVVLLYAYNGTGKTRLSTAFKNKGKQGGEDNRDTLYFNAFTEDLFNWDNDLEGDTERVLKINSASSFFNGFKELALEEKIFAYLERYAEFNFKIDYENWAVIFSKEAETHIKVSRGEENIFIWCIFLAVCELAIDRDNAYKWVKYIYIDDPISSLDDNNAIAVATDLSTLIKKGKDKVKVVISSHHNLFFNVMFNELRKFKNKRYFLHKNGTNGHTLRDTTDTPFFHHIALLSELKQVAATDNINTYHFNILRTILEKTATFFGFDDFARCVHGIEDEVLYARALNLLSHGKYSVYEPVIMGDDTKTLFKNVLQGFLVKYEFYLPELLMDE